MKYRIRRNHSDSRQAFRREYKETMKHERYFQRRGICLIKKVGVVLETIKQIESQMAVRYYKGFLND